MNSTPEIDMTFSPDVLAQKLLDADSGGFQAECTPEEAEEMGAFAEDALELNDVLNGTDGAAILA